MIEFILADRCIACNLCTNACPNDVFDRVAGGIPVIARQQDCVTCFICEAFCPTDAMYVAPNARPEKTDPADIVASGVLGSYRRALGWDRNRPGAADTDPPAPAASLPAPQATAWGVDTMPRTGASGAGR